MNVTRPGLLAAIAVTVALAAVAAGKLATDHHHPQARPRSTSVAATRPVALAGRQPPTSPTPGGPPQPSRPGQTSAGRDQAGAPQSPGAAATAARSGGATPSPTPSVVTSRAVPSSSAVSSPSTSPTQSRLPLPTTIPTASVSPPAPTASASPSPRAPSPSELQAALLTGAEVGPGFAQQPPGDGISEGSMTSVCPAVGQGASPSTVVVAAFEADPGSVNVTEVTEELLQFTPAQARAQLDQFATVASACSEFTFSLPYGSGTVPVHIALAQEAFSGVGDQDAAIRVTADLVTPGGDIVVSGDIVAVRHGGTVILVVNAALQLDTDLTASVVQAAYDKVAARW